MTDFDEAMWQEYLAFAVLPEQEKLGWVETTMLGVRDELAARGYAAGAHLLDESLTHIQNARVAMDETYVSPGMLKDLSNLLQRLAAAGPEVRARPEVDELLKRYKYLLDGDAPARVAEVATRLLRSDWTHKPIPRPPGSTADPECRIDCPACAAEAAAAALGDPRDRDAG